MEQEKDGLAVRFLYHTAFGRVVLRLLSARFCSVVAGRFLSSALSRPMVRPFMNKYGICRADYQKQFFESFNDFFCRAIRPECRPVDHRPEAFISPADGLLSVYRIEDGTVLPIKQSHYSISDLLGNDPISARYQQGYCLVFRLRKNDYHHYCYVDDGTKNNNTFISGVLHTVRPIALRRFPVFVRNCRSYTIMETAHFGTITQVEIGALLVGKITNLHDAGAFKKGQDKGWFEFGGSTVVLLVEPDTIRLDPTFSEDINSGKEYPVQFGQCVAMAVNETVNA